MKIKKIKLSNRFSHNRLGTFKDKIDFKTSKNLARFVEEGLNNVYISDDNNKIYRLVKITRIGHTSITGEFKAISRREINLEILLS